MRKTGRCATLLGFRANNPSLDPRTRTGNIGPANFQFTFLMSSAHFRRPGRAMASGVVLASPGWPSPSSDPDAFDYRPVKMGTCLTAGMIQGRIAAPLAWNDDNKRVMESLLVRMNSPDPVYRCMSVLQLLEFSDWDSQEYRYRKLLRRPDLPDPVRIALLSIVARYDYFVRIQQEAAQRDSDEERRERESQVFS